MIWEDSTREYIHDLIKVAYTARQDKEQYTHKCTEREWTRLELATSEPSSTDGNDIGEILPRNSEGEYGPDSQGRQRTIIQGEGQCKRQTRQHILGSVCGDLSVVKEEKTEEHRPWRTRRFDATRKLPGQSSWSIRRIERGDGEEYTYTSHTHHKSVTMLEVIEVCNTRSLWIAYCVTTTTAQIAKVPC